MKDTIFIRQTEIGWIAIYEGPHREKIEQLFNSNKIPTTFSQNAKYEIVRSTLQRNNPDVIVK